MCSIFPRQDASKMAEYEGDPIEKKKKSQPSKHKIRYFDADVRKIIILKQQTIMNATPATPLSARPIAASSDVGNNCDRRYVRSQHRNNNIDADMLLRDVFAVLRRLCDTSAAILSRNRFFLVAFANMKHTCDTLSDWHSGQWGAHLSHRCMLLERQCQELTQEQVQKKKKQKIKKSIMIFELSPPPPLENKIKKANLHTHTHKNKKQTWQKESGCLQQQIRELQKTDTHWRTQENPKNQQHIHELEQERQRLVAQLNAVRVKSFFFPCFLFSTTKNKWPV